MFSSLRKVPCGNAALIILGTTTQHSLSKKIKKIAFYLAVFGYSLAVQCSGQSKTSPSKAYVTTGGELIFSLANIEQNGKS